MMLQYQTDFSATQLEDYATPKAEDVFLSRPLKQTQLVIDNNLCHTIYADMFDQTPFYPTLRSQMLEQLNSEFSRMELTIDAIKKNITDFVLTESEKIKRIPYRDISVKLLTEDTLKININYNGELQIVIVRAFEEKEDDGHAPLVTLLENGKIVFQNRISTNNLVKSFLAVIQ